MDLRNENLYRSNTHSRTPVPTYVERDHENSLFAFTLHDKEDENFSLSEDKKFLDNLKKERKGGGEANKVNKDSDSSQDEVKSKEILSYKMNLTDSKQTITDKNKEKTIISSVHEENISKNDEEYNRNEEKEKIGAECKNKRNDQEKTPFPDNKNNEREKSFVSITSERKMSKFSYISEDKILKISLKAQENLMIDSFGNVPSQDQEVHIVKSVGDVAKTTDREDYLSKKTVGTKAYSDNNIKPLKVFTPSVELEPFQIKNKGSVSVAISGVSIIRTEESKTEKTDKTEGSKTPKKETTNSLNFKVGPEIFISMKKEKFSKHYEIGKILGEGTAKPIVFIIFFY